MNKISIIRAIIKRELIDTIKTFRLIMLGGLVCFNFSMYVTDTKIVEIILDKEALAYQFGTIMIYLSAMAILFIGTMMISKMFYDEKRNKTIHVALSMGIPERIMWIAKMMVVVAVCEIYSLLLIFSHTILMVIVFGTMPEYTNLLLVFTYLTIPVLAYSLLSIVSIAYIYFSRMNFFGMFIQIVPYLCIWQLSTKIMTITNVPLFVIVLSIVIAFILIMFAYFIVRLIPKERVITRLD